MACQEVAYLGPDGTYSHFVAEKRFGGAVRFTPQPTIYDVCAYVARHRGCRGIIPVENSSGGAIDETIDILLEGEPRVVIQEELALDVKLALLGHRGHKIRTLYSHAAPLSHCKTWLREHMPKVRKEAAPSTAAAARLAQDDPDAAAIGGRRLAPRYGLDVLLYPVLTGYPNITAFLAIGGLPDGTAGRFKTTLAARLPNVAGSLCTFLDSFRAESVNLSRILSRPIRGSPRAYAFLVDIDGYRGAPRVQRVLKTARRVCADLRVVGSYPVRRAYQS